MIEWILNGKSKKKKTSIYKDVMDNPEKYILTMMVDDTNEIVIRVRKKPKPKLKPQTEFAK